MSATTNRLAAALHDGNEHTSAGPRPHDHDPSPTLIEYAQKALAADPALAEAIEFGLAWQRAEAVLPEGWRFGSLRATVGFNGRVSSTVGWTATAYPKIGLSNEGRASYGPTPTAALIALAEQLEGAKK